MRPGFNCAATGNRPRRSSAPCCSARASAVRDRKLRARLEPGLPLLWCDAILLAQLLDNLIDNALKYSADEAPVELLVRRIDASVMLAVRDRGPGIAPAWQARVFDVFQRGADSSVRTRRRKWRYRARASAWAWRSAARSRARMAASCGCALRGHGGSSFECLLPVKEAPPRSAASAPEPARMTLRVLLVEDDRDLRATLRDALAGRRLRCAHGGQPGRSDCALLDARRPAASTSCCSTSGCPTATARPCSPRCGASATGRCS